MTSGVKLLNSESFVGRHIFCLLPKFVGDSDLLLLGPFFAFISHARDSNVLNQLQVESNKHMIPFFFLHSLFILMQAC